MQNRKTFDPPAAEIRQTAKKIICGAGELILFLVLMALFLYGLPILDALVGCDCAV